MARYPDEAVRSQCASTWCRSEPLPFLGHDLAGQLSLGQVVRIRGAAVWQCGHMSLGELWKLYSQYPYLPPFRDRRVLAEGVVQMPLLWQVDAFALTEAYDPDAQRYVGLWTRDDKAEHPRIVDLLGRRP